MCDIAMDLLFLSEAPLSLPSLQQLPPTSISGSFARGCLLGLPLPQPQTVILGGCLEGDCSPFEVSHALFHTMPGAPDTQTPGLEGPLRYLDALSTLDDVFLYHSRSVSLVGYFAYETMKLR